MGNANVWQILFMLAAYTSAIVCIYATWRIGVERGWRWGVIHLLIFGLFLLLFFVLESWAAGRTPYFSYPKPENGGFPDWIPFLKIPTDAPEQNCTNPVPANCGIPISVLLLEATITFAAMHTARLLADRKDLHFRLLRPFMAALALLLLDFFIDPLSSTSSSCVSMIELPHTGLAFWAWSVLPKIGPDAFGVPLFNYVVWYAMPVMLVALVGLLGWFYDFYLVPLVIAPGIVTLQFLLGGAFLGIIVFAFGLVIEYSPNFQDLPIWLLRLIFVGILLSTLIAIAYSARDFNYDNDFRWWFVYPQAVFLLFCLVAFLFSGMLATKLPGMWLVALVVSPLFVLWMLSPYLKRIWP